MTAILAVLFALLVVPVFLVVMYFYMMLGFVFAAAVVHFLRWLRYELYYKVWQPISIHVDHFIWRRLVPFWRVINVR